MTETKTYTEDRLDSVVSLLMDIRQEIRQLSDDICGKSTLIDKTVVRGNLQFFTKLGTSVSQAVDITFDGKDIIGIDLVTPDFYKNMPGVD